MAQAVWVLTNNKLGWDCVCGVFDSQEIALAYLNEDRVPEGHSDYDADYPMFTADEDSLGSYVLQQHIIEFGE